MIRSLACLLVVLAFGPQQASAQPYPSKPVRLVVPYNPGGGTDIMARLLAETMREDLGQPVLVVNKPGAGGALGASDVAHSPADGYTVLLTAGGFVIAPAVLRTAKYQQEVQQWAEVVRASGARVD